jgi:hypothetical protein
MKKKNIPFIFNLFLLTHLLSWTLIPFFSAVTIFFIVLKGFFIVAAILFTLAVCFLVGDFEILGIYINFSGRSIFSN